jgi:hypothetical protein
VPRLTVARLGRLLGGVKGKGLWRVCECVYGRSGKFVEEGQGEAGGLSPAVIRLYVFYPSCAKRGTVLVMDGARPGALIIWANRR